MDLVTLALAKKYTKDSLKGAGALKGETGKSAYEIAVSKGFVGTEQEWVASLKGNPGDKGDPFTYSDFTEDQLNTLIGPDGRSAFEIAKEHGFTGSEAEWLTSLDGSIAIMHDASEVLWEGQSVTGGTMALSANLYKYAMLCVTVGNADCLVFVPHNAKTFNVFGGKLDNGTITLSAANLSTENGLTVTNNGAYFMEQRSGGTNGSRYGTYITKIQGVANIAMLAE